MIIRQAKKEESITISDILAAAFMEFKNKYTPGAFSFTVVSPEEAEARMETGVVWIVYMNKEAVGTVSGLIKEKTFYIQGMGVKPEWRGHKIGYQLLRTIEAYAKKNECQHLLLSTTPYLFAAIKLYLDFGFEIINEPPYDLHDTPLFNMRKHLK